ncbi:HlyD family efflux transporter periplasmic adaptor subunit [Phenylobacterium sp.]|uniref:HlyD family secretion protein n=1 Tax=Phenylobacterium sp. TaxID=1871053 RepID=UPI002F421FB3
MADSAPAPDRGPATAATSTPTQAPAAAPARPANARRSLLFGLLTVVILALGLGYFVYWFTIGRTHVATDDAYVNADSADITPQVAGQVIRVLAQDTQPVKQGQVLVQIDPADAKVALDQAQAELDQATRKVNGYFANEQALSGQVAVRAADITKADAQIMSAQSDLDRARTELGRRQRLAQSGAVSGDELTQAENQAHVAEAALAQARAAKIQANANRGAALGTQAVNTALISGAPVAENPEVTAARAKVAKAQLDFDRTTLRAPFDGVIAKKNVALGEQVQVGAPLMQVVPISRAYVDANFKEVQLRHVRLGQPVTLTADLYGGHVKFHGRVAGVAGGTGAAFALIPAQNATGNWIKIVQRLPVRVSLDPEELKAHPLRVGLSMKAVIDVSGG